ncbi:hypothetical protein MSEO_10020 [Mycobacterium seoulense]|uniref:Uncharacterized protein n=1 Tax=Mycobacterium seoulense TaxID=386911 RepID=A0A7I7NV50_9MYCO|nr:hypothetical protein MSEO_10020 [Mycobacterium seoulense]
MTEEAGCPRYPTAPKLAVPRVGQRAPRQVRWPGASKVCANLCTRPARIGGTSKRGAAEEKSANGRGRRDD